MCIRDRWWGLWWPRALRRPNDIWLRLPRPARAVRLMLTTFFIVLPGLILAREWLAARGFGPAHVAGIDVFVAGEVALVLGTALAVAAGFWWTSRRELTVAQGARMLFGATSPAPIWDCLLYTSDAADERSSVDLGGRRIIKKK